MIRVPKDSLRKQLALAADYIVQLLGRVAELESALAAHDHAAQLARDDAIRACWACWDSQAEAERWNGRVLIGYGVGIAGIAGLIVGGIWL